MRTSRRGRCRGRTFSHRWPDGQPRGGELRGVVAPGDVGGGTVRRLQVEEVQQRRIEPPWLQYRLQPLRRGGGAAVAVLFEVPVGLVAFPVQVGVAREERRAKKAAKAEQAAARKKRCVARAKNRPARVKGVPMPRVNVLTTTAHHDTVQTSSAKVGFACRTVDPPFSPVMVLGSAKGCAKDPWALLWCSTDADLKGLAIHSGVKPVAVPRNT